jgi:hypothetical protein
MVNISPLALHQSYVTPSFEYSDISHNNIGQVATSLSGYAGLGGVDSQSVYLIAQCK